MVPGAKLGILVLRLIPGLLNSEPESHRTRNTCSSHVATGGLRIHIVTRPTSTGLNSRNIYPKPIDSLKEYQASEKEINYETDKEEHCAGHVRLNMSVRVRWNKK